MKNKIKQFGFVVLSFLVCMAIYSVVMEYTYHQASLLLRVALLFLVFVLFVRFYALRYALISVWVLVAIIISILFYDPEGNEDYERYFIFGSIVVGSIFGYLWRIKKHKWLAAFGGFAGFLFYFVYVNYYTVPRFERPPAHELALANENRSFLIGHRGEHPTFHQDTVYLLNFSFQNCLPCRVKKKYTPEIIERFKNQPFRLIEIHIFEEKKIFDESYMLYYPYVYHDSLKRLTKLFGVTGGPTEFVFNKNGKAVRKHEGFDHDVAKNYVNQTTELIQKLLAE